MKDNFCKKCGKELVLSLTPEKIHFGRLDCPNCGFYAWASHPDRKPNDLLRVGRKTVEQVCSFHKFNEERCFLCLRKRNELGYSETLTCDHIIELDKGGQDIIENQQVLCSACHKIKNWLRLYLNWHLNKEQKKDGDTKTITTKGD